MTRLPFYFFNLLLTTFAITSCDGQIKPDSLKDSTNIAQPIIDNGLGLPKDSQEMKSFLDAGIDPYFIETTDTFSTRDLSVLFAI